MALRTALITGITGHNGSDLAELPLKKGYTVHGNKQQRQLHLKSFQVVGSMKNPPTRSLAAAAGGKG